MHVLDEGDKGLGCKTGDSSSHAVRSSSIWFSVQASKLITYEESFSLLKKREKN